MQKLVTLIPISRQMIDEAEEVAKAESWDTLPADLESELARFHATANGA